MTSYGERSVWVLRQRWRAAPLNAEWWGVAVAMLCCCRDSGHGCWLLMTALLQQAGEIDLQKQRLRCVGWGVLAPLSLGVGFIFDVWFGVLERNHGFCVVAGGGRASERELHAQVRFVAFLVRACLANIGTYHLHTQWSKIEWLELEWKCRYISTIFSIQMC